MDGTGELIFFGIVNGLINAVVVLAQQPYMWVIVGFFVVVAVLSKASKRRRRSP
jgi:hypothetical protein